MSMHNPKFDLTDLDDLDLTYLLDGLVNLKEVVDHGDWYSPSDCKREEKNFNEKYPILEQKIRQLLKEHEEVFVNSD